MHVSKVYSVYKNVAGPSSSSIYRPISFLSIISKYVEAIINKLCDKQYSFHAFRSTANILPIIQHRISEEPNIKQRHCLSYL